MKGKNLINTLLSLRLTYYRAGILERLRRFKLLIFFVLAMAVPTIAFMLQIIQTASLRLMNGMEHSSYFVSLITFQLIAIIWVGSQHECLKIPDVENYLRTFKISDIRFFIIELLFGTIINLPFLAFLIIGIFSLAGQHLLSLDIAHFIYLFSSLLYLSICLIFSRALLTILLIITNALFIYFHSLEGSLFLVTALALVAYYVITKRMAFPGKIATFFPISKLRLSRFSPNVYLNLKNLLIWNKVYTSCIFAINLLTLFLLVSYTLAQDTKKPVPISFLIALNVAVFFYSLLIYKITETRKIYGIFFSTFYTTIQTHFLDLITIYLIVLFHFITIILVGLYLGFNTILMLKSLFIATGSAIIFSSLNRCFSFYGPVISLLILAGILIVSRGLLSCN